jgi:hypothetical protein
MNHHKIFTSRINRISKQLQQENPGFSVIKQYPGESDEDLLHRVELLNKENIRRYGQEILIVTIRTFSKPGGRQ